MKFRYEAFIISDREKVIKEIKNCPSSVANSEITVMNFEDLYKAIREKTPDFIFVDLDTGVESIFLHIEKITKLYINIPLFAMSQGDDQALALRAMRLGAWDYINMPLEEAVVASTINRALDRKRIISQDGQLIVLFSSKGGLGNTTISLNLADHICRLTHSKTVVVDLNTNMGDMSVFADTKPSYTFLNLIRDLNRLDEDLLYSSLPRHRLGFYMLLTENEIARKQIISQPDAARVFKELKKYMDYIIVDSCHDFNESTIAALDIADKIFMLMHQDIASINQAKKLLNLFSDTDYISSGRVNILLNRFHKYSNYSINMIEEVLEHKVFEIISNDYAAVNKAISEAKAIDEINSSSPVNKDIIRLAEKITGFQRSRKSKGLFKKLLSGQIICTKRK